jgi:hypothetical protein
MHSSQTEVHNAITAINQAWRDGRPAAMEEYLHPAITMVLPGFVTLVEGREALLASFVEFCRNARVIDYGESEEQIQVIGNVAVVSFRFTMLYERATYRERSSGRDLWVFQRFGAKWIAVWRTMVDLKDERVP